MLARYPKTTVPYGLVNCESGGKFVVFLTSMVSATTRYSVAHKAHQVTVSTEPEVHTVSALGTRIGGEYTSRGTKGSAWTAVRTSRTTQQTFIMERDGCSPQTVA